MPVSTDGLGSGRRARSGSCSNCMKTRFQISIQRSQSQAGPWQGRPAAASAQGRSSPWWKWISLHGPQGPVSPMAQKLSLSPEPDDAAVVDPRDLLPQDARFVVAVVDGVDQALRVDGEVLGQKLVGEGDGVGLEVVAEREVAQHLEEGVVARGAADVLQVVVLAPGAHALLRAGGARDLAAGLAGEHVLELVHARIGEQQRRIVGGNQGRARHFLVALAGEIVEECAADLAGRTVSHGARRLAPPASPVTYYGYGERRPERRARY